MSDGGRCQREAPRFASAPPCQRVLSRRRRSARDRRRFLRLATAAGVGFEVAAALRGEVVAGPIPQALGRRRLAAAYDYIVIGAGSAGCTIAARLSENPACRVLLIEEGGGDIERPMLQSPVLLPSTFGTDVDWAYPTIPQARAARRVVEWPRGKILGGSSSINAMIWVWGHVADFDQWAYAGCRGWDYASLRPLFQKVENCAQGSVDGIRGVNGPMHVESLAEPHPLAAGRPVVVTASTSIIRRSCLHGRGSGSCGEREDNESTVLSKLDRIEHAR